MKLIAQIAAGVFLGLFGLWFLIAMGSEDPAHASSEAAPASCDSADIQTSAANQLGKWLDQNVGKDNAFHLHGTFVTEVSQSFEMGALQGTKQCFASVSIGMRRSGGGSLVVSPEPIHLNFMLNGSRVTFNDAELLSGPADVAGSLLFAESIRQQQADATQPLASSQN